MGETSSSPTISTKLQQIAKQAQDYPEMVFTTLVHQIDVDFLREAFHKTRKDAAPGVDGVTAQAYAVHLEENLQDLHARLRTGKYRAQPVVRVWLAKEDGSQRPIGKPVFEDKVVQRAVVMLLEAVYEQDFYACSYGFRPGRSGHQALHELRTQCMEKSIGWIVDLDVCGFFDNLDHTGLREILSQRVGDGGLLRLIGKWLNAGVIEDEQVSYPDKGTPQGGVHSPILGNLFLHHVLDEWFETVVKPRMQGHVFLIRFADDAIIGCQLASDAQRIMEVLPKRFGRFGLTLHREKTRLVRFGRPQRRGQPDRPNGTFDFLGFRHYWGKSRRCFWVVKRKTARKRVRRAVKMFWRWCREHRHEPLGVQHATLCQKLRGYYQYYAIRGNYRVLAWVQRQVVRAWRYWLSRRSHRSGISWERFETLCQVFPLPKPRILHAI